MVGQRDPLIADLFRRLHKIADRIGLAADIDDRQGHAEFHLPSLWHQCLRLRACFAPALLATMQLGVIAWIELPGIISTPSSPGLSRGSTSRPGQARSLRNWPGKFERVTA